LLIEAFLFFLLVTAGEAAVPDQKNVPDDLVMPFLSDRRSGVMRGREAPVRLHVCVLVLGYLGFRDSSINVMVGWMLMVLVGITVSQPMLLLVGCDAGADKSFVEPKLLEWL
jgi:sugar phosphate permease